MSRGVIQKGCGEHNRRGFMECVEHPFYVPSLGAQWHVGVIDVGVTQWQEYSSKLTKKQGEKSVTPLADQSAVFRCDERGRLVDYD